MTTTIGGALNAQHHLAGRHACFDAVCVRDRNRTPVEFVVVNELVQSHRVSQMPASLQYARRGLGVQTFNRTDGTLVVPLTVQIFCFKFIACLAQQFLLTFLEENFSKRCVDKCY